MGCTKHLEFIYLPTNTEHHSTHTASSSTLYSLNPTSSPALCSIIPSSSTALYSIIPTSSLTVLIPLAHQHCTALFPNRCFWAAVYSAEHFHCLVPFHSIATNHKPPVEIMNSQKPTTVQVERGHLSSLLTWPWSTLQENYPKSRRLYHSRKTDLNPGDYISH